MRARVDQVLRFERLRADTASAHSSDDTASYVPTSGDAAHPERLGGYVTRGERGRGGMGVVLRADDPRLGRPVAVKVMLPGLEADAAARAVAALRHERVVPVYHVGEDAGTPYLVMPLLERKTLAERLRRGPLPVPELVRVGRSSAGCCSALSSAC